jgi:hypothetical protein
MDGRNLKAGAVARVKTVKNPISAARKVMEETWHVMLSGDGADKFAKDAVSKRYGLIVEIENLNRDSNTEEQLSLENKHNQLQYVYGEKKSNLEHLIKRHEQDREQLLHLSSAIDEDSIQEALEYEKRVGLEDIDIKSYDKPNQEEALSGLRKLAQETQSFDYLELERKLTKPSEKKALEQDLDKE